MPTTKSINAGPTKAFFVTMLTRDIELADAILDLLDNCVDGVVREIKKAPKTTSNGKPYKGYQAQIAATPTKFEILDNCGGIPQDIAEKSAFMLGRPDSNRDSDIETVGMYGIGMKRAMFKMGRHSVVKSQPSTGAYKVVISAAWLDDEPDHSKQNEDPWKLSLVPTEKKMQEDGTRITVTDLHKEIARQFNTEKSTFLSDLEKEISRHYALIMEKGFTVILNGEKIEPVSLTILAPASVGGISEETLEPYIFRGLIDDVHVDLVVGFYRPLITEDELEDEDFVASSRENAGWTVICNDRVVLYNDKTFKTGWGTKGVTPGYHNQFISIRGIVSFRSNKSMSLPLNTTKRGLATDSDLYQSVIGYMRSGLKHFTSFTNRWKKQAELTAPMFKSLTQRSLNQIISKVQANELADIHNMEEAQQYVPRLPKPEPLQKSKRICFPAEQADIEAVADYYFDDADHDRSEVGKRCFEESLKRAKRGKQ